MEKTRSEPTPGRAMPCASLGGLLLLVAASAAAGEPGIRLSLEHELVQGAASAGPLETIGVTGLRRQVGAVRDVLEEVREANAEQARTVALAERRAAGLAQLNAAQTRALDVLESLARARATSPSAATAAATLTASGAAAGAGRSETAVPASVVWLAGASIPALAPSWGAVFSGLGALAVVGIAGFGAVRGRRLAGTPPQGSAKAPRAAPRAAPAPARGAPGPAESSHRPRPAASGEAPAPGAIAPAAAAPSGSPSSRETGPSDARPEETGPEETGPEVLAPRSAADRQAVLRELDTLIAFEDYEGASRALAPLVAAEPENAEYRLRLAHIEAQRGNATVSDRELEVLSAMMDGPLSDTMARVRRIGRDLMPGNPAFDGPAPGQLPGATGPAGGDAEPLEECSEAVLEDAADAPRAIQL